MASLGLRVRVAGTGGGRAIRGTNASPDSGQIPWRGHVPLSGQRAKLHRPYGLPVPRVRGHS
jgi:hypothetical protein